MIMNQTLIHNMKSSAESTNQRSHIVSNLVYHFWVRVLIAILCCLSLFISLRILVWYFESSFLAENNIAILTMLDVGQGDGFAIDLPGGQKIVIDVGSSANQFKESLFSENAGAGFLGNIFNPSSLRKTFDFAFLTHDDADHAGAMPALSKVFEIGAAGVSPLKYSYLEKTDLNEAQILDLLVRGMKISFLNNEDATTSTLSILFPDLGKVQSANSSDKDFSKARSANEHSLIMKFVHGSTSVLFTGDAGIEEEGVVLSTATSATELKSDILKVGHHGSKGSTGKEFLEKVNPHIALISAGVKNRYGHPHSQVLENLKTMMRSDQIIRTDMCSTHKLLLYKNGAIRHRSCRIYK